MSKNLLKSKIFIFLIFTFSILQPLTKVSADWVETNADYWKQVKHDFFGSCLIQTKAVPLTYVGYANMAGGVFYKVYGDPSIDSRFKNFCASVKPKYLFINIPPDPLNIYGVTDEVGDEVILKNDDGPIANFDIWYGILPSRELRGADSDDVYKASGSKSAYEVCKEANKVSIAGLDTNGNYVNSFETLDQCKQALLERVDIKPGPASLDSTNQCSLVNIKGSTGTIAQYDPGIGKLPVWERCKCMTYITPGRGYPYGDGAGIFFVDANGNLKEYAKTDVTYVAGTSLGLGGQWREAAYKCLKENNLLNNKQSYHNINIGGCYQTLSSCKAVTCDTRNDGDYNYKDDSGSDTWYKDYGEFQTKIKGVCGGKSGADYNSCLQKYFKRCECSYSYNIYYDWLLCSTVGSTTSGKNCNKVCKLLDIDLQRVNPIEINNPLALFRVVSNFLFWVAVILFILNFLTGGLEYVRSSDEPEKLKEATTRLTNTLFGFIFILVIAGVVNYLITLFDTIVR